MALAYCHFRLKHYLLVSLLLSSQEMVRRTRKSALWSHMRIVTGGSPKSICCSAGLRAVPVLAKTVEPRHGRFAVCALAEEVDGAFRTSGFDRIMQVYDSLRGRRGTQGAGGRRGLGNPAIAGANPMAMGQPRRTRRGVVSTAAVPGGQENRRATDRDAHGSGSEEALRGFRRPTSHWPGRRGDA